MQALVAQSYTRLTLALDIVRKLTSGPLAGYHELAVVKHQIDLCDTIEMSSADATSVQCDDPRVPCDQSNICWKAVDLVRKTLGRREHVAIRIDKRIPVMGGLAGGSANAATTLMLLNDLWKLGLTRGLLQRLGRDLGMDVPYYFTGGTAFDTEAAGELRSLRNDLSFIFVLVVPKFGVSTADAYAGIDYSQIARSRDKTDRMVRALADGDRKTVIQTVHNDFEHSVFVRHPKLRQLKERLRRAGCPAAFMSGSGSTIVGIAGDRAQAEQVREVMAAEADVQNVLCCETIVRAKMI
jgi:4-diphosphocytidyl-2-C-methyl-D-erythritol kinase